MTARLAATLAALAVTAAAGAAAAHDSFIVPPGPLAAGRPVRLEITSSGAFPTPGSAIRPTRVARIEARAGDTPLAPTLEAGDRAMTATLVWPATIPPHQNGVVATIDLSPVDIDVGPDEIAHYMDEIGASPEVRAAVAAAVARDGVMRETYVKHLKTMACIDLCDGLAPSRPSGSALEFVASDEAWVLLENGRPRIGQAVFVTTRAQGRRRLTTDRQGRILLPADLNGPVFIGAVVLRPPATPDERFTSDWAALTFDASLLAR